MMDENPGHPNPIGVFRAVSAPTFEEVAASQVSEAIAKRGAGSIEELVYDGETWEVS